MPFVVVYDSSGRPLSGTGYLDGHWALPSGHAIDGEDALTAASRELLEETSLIVKPEDWQFHPPMHRGALGRKAWKGGLDYINRPDRPRSIP